MYHGDVLIDGKKISREIEAELATGLQGTPGLAMMLVGSYPPSETYVGTKQRACERVGIRSEVVRLPASATQKEVIDEIHRLNRDPSIHGILVQLPLPDQVDTTTVHLAIDPRKDVDGFNPINQGKLLAGHEDAFVACTPYGVHELLIRSKVPIEGQHVVIVGRSHIVGKPLAALLVQKRKNCNATVTIAHSRTKDLKKVCQSADILVAAIGQPKFITEDMVSDGVVVIDVGLSRVGEGLVGDVDFENVRKKASKITPVPGGVGPMTVAMLLKNTCESYSRLSSS